MRHARYLIPLLATALLAAACTPAPSAPQKQAELASPDGSLRLEFALDDAGTPYYSLSRDGVAVVLPSRMGFALRGTVKAEQLDYAADGLVTKSDTAPEIAYGEIPDYTWSAWDGSSQILFTTGDNGKKIAVVSVNSDGKAVAYGSATLAVKTS